jgi:hypothetical protein
VIKMLAQLHGRRTLFLGLTRENTARLHGNEPIAVDVQALLAQVPESDAVQDVIIFAGEDLKQVHGQLKPFFPDLPPFEEPTP